MRELIAVGQPIGVKLFSDGVLVIGFSDGDTAAKACGLKEGDIITALGGESLDTIEELRACLNANGGSGAELTVKRGSRTLTLEASPQRDESGEYRLGAWVRDSMAGIGTMTFYDPQSGTFGALGHGVTDVDTGKLLPLDHGSIMNASVKAVKRENTGRLASSRATLTSRETAARSMPTPRAAFLASSRRRTRRRSAEKPIPLQKRKRSDRDRRRFLLR